MNRIKTVDYTNETDILIAPESYLDAMPVVVKDTGVTAGADGKKIIKAGTPLYAASDIFMNPQTKMQGIAAAEGGKPYGIARWDIDVTEGENNGTMINIGVVDYLKLDASVQALIDDQKANLTRILFRKGRKD